MTLNVTIISERCIYQSSDFRLVNTVSGNHEDLGRNHKTFLINRGGWHATLCYCGVGTFGVVHTTEWVTDRIAQLEYNDPIEKLIDELLLANTWLARVPAPYNRHSFSIGAFVGVEPRFILVSNFEKLGERPSGAAGSTLVVSEVRPSRPKTYVSGQSDHVLRQTRRRLEHLVADNVAPETVYAALAKVNRDVSENNRFVSKGCFTTHIRRTGEGGGLVHGVEVTVETSLMPIPIAFQAATKEIVDRQFGPGKSRLGSMAMVRSEPTEAFHKLQLREKPLDPSVHSNYGVFLLSHQHDAVAAEEAYRRALELDPTHTNALGNLANVLAMRNDFDGAEQLYRKALERQPVDENAVFNFARFLVKLNRDSHLIRELLNTGLGAHPRSGRLLLLLGQVELTHDPIKAVEAYLGRKQTLRGASRPGALPKSGYGSWYQRAV